MIKIGVSVHKSIKLINLNKKEEPVFVTYTAPAMYTYASMDEETPGAKRFVEAQEIQLSDNGDGTYTVIIKNLGDCGGDPAKLLLSSTVLSTVRTSQLHTTSTSRAVQLTQSSAMALQTASTPLTTPTTPSQASTL